MEPARPRGLSLPIERSPAAELIRLAFPLILSHSITTLQVTIDRILLSGSSAAAVAAAMPAVVLWWTPIALLQNTANYATTFVAQYVGAGRPQRVGPAVWQALHFSVIAGFLFLLLIPLAPYVIAWGGHTSQLQELEFVYFRCLCFATVPFLIVAATSSFFAGRGDSWTVLLINAVGMGVNAILDYAWIYGHWGFPEWGIAGAGWATVVGTTVSAALGLILLFQSKYEHEFCTRSGWRFDRELFWRLMRFGFPSGLQWMFDALAFTMFMFFVGRFGEAALAATSIAFTINMVAILPMLGMGQAVGILVGQRLGENRPERAEQSTWAGFSLAWLYMAAVAALYVIMPEAFLWLFRGRNDAEQWTEIAATATVLLRFVAVYSLFDSMSLVFSFGLRGAGDTRFVTCMLLLLSWPLMVAPTWAAAHFGWGLYWAWGFASCYVIALALVFLARFRTGIWKNMRVIEAPPPVEPEPALLSA